MAARAKVKPLLVRHTILIPDISMVLTITPSPLVITNTITTPNTTVSPSALSIVNTIVTPDLVLGVGASPLVVTHTFPEPTVNLV